VQQCTGATRQPGGALCQVRQQVPGLLHGPRAVRVHGHAQDMDMAGAGLDNDEHVDPAQGHRAAGMEEIARQHRGRVRAQELPPRRAAALRRGRNPQPSQDPPHREGPGPVPPGRVARPGSADSPSRGSPAPSARSAPRAWRQLAAVLPWEDRPAASGPAAGASAAACLASPAGSSAAPWGAARPGRRVPRGPPSPALAWGSAAAAPRPRGAATAARHPSTPPNAPAAPSSQSGGRRSGRASVPSQAADTARPAMSVAAILAGQKAPPRFAPRRISSLLAGLMAAHGT